MKLHRSTGLFVACGSLALGVAACGSSNNSADGGGDTAADSSLSGSIAGAGASTQAAAQEAWAAGFQTKNSGTTVSYDPVGSGGGREQFVAGGKILFAGSDAALEGDELAAAQKRCGGPDNLIEAPIYISPIAIAYNLDGVDNLQLSPQTLASIFKRDIKKWNDPKIAKDNPDAKLPDTRIATVHRSDESGTTENFVDYLSVAAPDVWKFEVSGDWPVKGGEAAQGTSGVVGAIKAGSGTIGYADESQARDLSIAKIKVGEEFVEPSTEAAAKIVDASPESDDPGKYVFTYKLARDTTESGAYPIVLASYEIACTKYDTPADGELVKAYLGYISGAEGQKVAADAAGSAPISDKLNEQVQSAVDAIGGT
ncbi:MAG: phosphate ABC transporter substrate-binding protein PstS [Solirubrobacteraceae bacterium]